jgi:hypothetical protein
VVEDVRLRLHEPLERPVLADEVGHEHLDRRAGRGPHRLDRPSEMLRTAVGQIVAGHARDHHVLEAEPSGRLGDPLRLVVLEHLGLTLGHRAEATGPRADVAEDHERRRLLRPALEPVGTLGRRADRFEVQFGDQAGGLAVAAAGAEILP